MCTLYDDLDVTFIRTKRPDERLTSDLNGTLGEHHVSLAPRFVRFGSFFALFLAFTA